MKFVEACSRRKNTSLWKLLSQISTVLFNRMINLLVYHFFDVFWAPGPPVRCDDPQKGFAAKVMPCGNFYFNSKENSTHQTMRLTYNSYQIVYNVQFLETYFLNIIQCVRLTTRMGCAKEANAISSTRILVAKVYWNFP